ncbi:DUF3307 domain-containing protein [Pelosinus propionicus]|uniref:DUF3307 domain-containing protein n=1 Tax=Pelosinus propionicus DSM 13327 TaxID=1123291 RepID=A0A1I4NIJ0_9FIRM|nr:DUF3307 domain-containing protein [Pelosinus propionicus]SFM15334.1 Protein of unknown function [Pelosinus propionicus DSM 13327]
MDAKVILVLLLLSHIVTDFILQDDAIAEKKKTCSKAMLRHIKHYLAANIILLSPYLDINNNLWWVIILLTLAHWIIDKCKVKYDKKKDKGLESFMFDQAAHIILIVSCYPFIKDIYINSLADAIGSFIVDNYPIFLHLTKQKVFIGITILLGYIFNFKGATVITKKVLDKYLHLKNDEPISENEKKNAGEAIGNLERILILTLVLQMNYATIGLVLAGKTIARYKKLEEKNFAEYFLIGTFTSMIVAFATGALIQAVTNL